MKEISNLDTHVTGFMEIHVFTILRCDHHGCSLTIGKCHAAAPGSGLLPVWIYPATQDASDK